MIGARQEVSLPALIAVCRKLEAVPDRLVRAQFIFFSASCFPLVRRAFRRDELWDLRSGTSDRGWVSRRFVDLKGVLKRGFRTIRRRLVAVIVSYHILPSS